MALVLLYAKNNALQDNVEQEALSLLRRTSFLAPMRKVSARLLFCLLATSLVLRTTAVRTIVETSCDDRGKATRSNFRSSSSLAFLELDRGRWQLFCSFSLSSDKK